MLVSKSVMMRSNTYMKKYYESKGYVVGKRGTSFEISVDDLSPNSNAVVDVICDYCGKQHRMTWYKYLKSLPSGNCCKKCTSKKVEFQNLIRYGVKNTSQLPEVRMKVEATCLRRYGFKTNLSTEETKAKVRKTNLERYGFETTLQNTDIKNKSIETSIKNFGTKNPMQNDKVKSKVRESLYKNGTTLS